MTRTEFVRIIAQEAKKQERPVFAVDFAPMLDGLEVIFRFKEKR